MPIVTHSVGGFPVTCDAEAFTWYLRAVGAGMPLGGITSDYRDPAEQERLFRARYRAQAVGSGNYGDVRWWRGVRYVRTSSAGPVAPPGSSRHETGLAIDFKSAQANWLALNPEFGWRRPRNADGSWAIPSEWWHYEYKRSWATATTASTSTDTEDDMTPEELEKGVRDGITAWFKAAASEETVYDRAVGRVFYDAVRAVMNDVLESMAGGTDTGGRALRDRTRTVVTGSTATASTSAEVKALAGGTATPAAPVKFDFTGTATPTK